MSAFIIPVGQEASNPSLLNVADHIEHMKANNKVFWNVGFPGASMSVIRKSPWKYDDISTGYFYIYKTKKISYEFEIDYVKQIMELDFPNIQQYVPKFRLKFFEPISSKYSPNDYAFLLNKITPLQPMKNLNHFRLLKSGKPVKKIRYYAIVEDL